MEQMDKGRGKYRKKRPGRRESEEERDV